MNWLYYIAYILIFVAVYGLGYRRGKRQTFNANESKFHHLYLREKQDRKDLEKWIKVNGFKCPHCGKSGLDCHGMQG